MKFIDCNPSKDFLLGIFIKLMIGKKTFGLIKHDKKKLLLRSVCTQSYGSCTTGIKCREK